jgi:hypothetical protein
MLQSVVEVVTMLMLRRVPRPLKQRRKTLILDLDETLVHSTLHSQRHDFLVEVVQERSIVYYVSKRPYLDLFLRQVFSIDGRFGLITRFGFV